MCVFLSKIILTDSNLFFYLYAFLGNPQLLIITLEDPLQQVMEEEVLSRITGEPGANLHLCAVEAPSRKAQEAHQIPRPDLHLVTGNDSVPLV